ncbi:uncharacterized protein CXorf65 homolog [Harpia harpyja]|uniref:uncharacterized protein CXorf65 homolog n=1 Tax=Harpia harpyja TaxID=202280 RepID=UPI0022B1821E|nr:uncharacterized protein CXorf65 homolog [Harpia harpyja]
MSPLALRAAAPRAPRSSPTVPAPGPGLTAAAHSSTSSCQGRLLHLATAALPADDQSLPANASCTVLQLVSYVRRMVGVPDTGEPWLRGCSSPPALAAALALVSPPVGCHAGSPWCGRSGEVGGSPAHYTSSPRPTPAFPNIIHLCDELGTPKLVFQVTSLSERASEFLQACGTYYMCRVEFGAPGTEEEHTRWSFTLLLEHPSPALTGG